MEVKHCVECGKEVWGNRIFEIRVCDCGKGSITLCPACAKEFALDILGRVYVVERYTEVDDSNECS